jgi:predicted DNA-binding transcriptional regulator YafY
MDILKHGTHCEVLGPASLRRVVGDEVKRLGEKYF